ncbi:MAG: hypothetical protein CMH57_14095 [Myxococcales bacterium]|nr:hypothetical protein [Myxococcales bacterium]
MQMTMTVWTLSLLTLLSACGGAEEQEPAVEDADTGASMTTMSPDAGEDNPCEGQTPATPTSACPSGEFSDDGICLPLQPVLVPPEGCPGELVEEGTCQPLPPATMAWSCPDGWRQVTPLAFIDEAEAIADDVVDLVEQQQVCAPPETPDDCPAGTMALLGEPDCVPVGSACPPDAPWPDEATLRQRAGDAFAAGQIVYVSADADPDGDGSREAPAQTVAAALAIADDGDVVAVGVGRYDEAVALDRPVALLGACAASTTLAAPTADDEAGTLTVSGAGVRVGDLTVTGPRPGIVVEASGDAVLEGVQAHEATKNGVWIRGGTATLRRSAIRETRSNATQELGYGLNVTDGASLEATQLFIWRNRRVGLRVDGAETHALASDAIIAETRPQELDDTAGIGLAVQNGASLEGERLVVANNRTYGVYMTLGGTAHVTDLHVQGTLAQASDGTQGYGIVVSTESSLEAERVVLERNTRSGAILFETGHVRFLDAVITGTQPGTDNARFGRGVGVEDGSVFEGERLLLTHNHTTGIYVRGEARLTDVTVAHTQPEADRLTAGQGIYVTSGGVMTGERLTLLHNHQVGLHTNRDGSSSVTDVTVRGTRPMASNDQYGRGMEISLGGQMEGRRVLLVDNNNFGIFMGAALPGSEEFGVYRTTEATLSEVTILQTHGATPSAPGRYGYGWGVGVYQGTQLHAERFMLARNEEGGFGVTDEGSRAVVRDLVIRDTQPLAFDNSRGAGLGSFSQGAIEGERVRLENHHAASLLGFREASGVFTDLTILNTQPQQLDMDFGRAMSIESGSSLTATRVLIEDSHDASVVSTQANTHIDLTDLIIHHTAPRPYDMNSGVGVSVSHSASATLNRFSIDGSALVGLQIVDDSALTAHAGRIVDNFIGLNVQSEGFDPDQSLSCVDIMDNCCGQDCATLVCNVESQDLVIPAAFEVVDAVDMDQSNEDAK